MRNLCRAITDRPPSEISINLVLVFTVHLMLSASQFSAILAFFFVCVYEYDSWRIVSRSFIATPSTTVCATFESHVAANCDPFHASSPSTAFFFGRNRIMEKLRHGQSVDLSVPKLLVVLVAFACFEAVRYNLSFFWGVCACHQ